MGKFERYKFSAHCAILIEKDKIIRQQGDDVVLKNIWARIWVKNLLETNRIALKTKQLHLELLQ